MNMRSLINLGLLVFVFWAQDSMATTCAVRVGSSSAGGRLFSGNLPGYIAVSNDIPRGTELYSQTITGDDLTWGCWGSDYDYKKTLSFTVGLTPDASAYTKDSTYKGPIYPTTISGIGFYYQVLPGGVDQGTWNGQTWYPHYPSVGSCPAGGDQTNACVVPLSPTKKVKFVLVKSADTIDLPKGVTLDGSTFGTGIVTADMTGSTGPFYGNQFNMTGKTNFVIPTCKAGNVTVPLGSHNISEFDGDNSTPWTKFNILFTNCMIKYISPSITYSPAAIAPNFDATEGVFALDDLANSAQGIGVQLADASNTPIPLNLNRTVDTTISGSTNTDGSGNWTIPLSARYTRIMTPDGLMALKPGKAGASLTFTLTYQ